LAAQYSLYRGTIDQQGGDLPLLDVEKAVVIGGGADYGDDTWIVLDYRPNLKSPRVLASQWQAGTTGPHLQWVELAPSFEAFWQLVCGTR
jgi:hypothetical protein